MNQTACHNTPNVIVSIVVPTCNRLDRLKACLDKITHAVTLPHEVIVVDGASTDGTSAYLGSRHDVRAIFEERREGAVKAFNRGFRAARGRYVTWLNDDARPLPGAFDAAVRMIERPDLADVGMIALYHTWHNDRNILHEIRRNGIRYCICHVRGRPYANFGLLRRSLLARVGYADEGYRFFGFDPDLALRIQEEHGLLVLGCPEALIDHDEHHDDRKLADLDLGRADNERLFSRWNLPDPGAYPDPCPAYLQRIRDRGVFTPDDLHAPALAPAG